MSIDLLGLALLLTLVARMTRDQGVAFDQTHGMLYILEPLDDEDRPQVHVWKVR